MSDIIKVNRPAPLKNVSAFSILLEKLVERRMDLPGLGCFYGASGLGKTKAAIFGANRYRALYVECDQFTTAKSLLTLILKELGVQRPKGTVPDMIEEAVRILSSDIRRPLIIDEAHNVAHKNFIDLARTLHDKSMAPVVLIGEETLPKQLEKFERVHNRMLDWVAAVPCDGDDFAQLVKNCCSKDIVIADDLAKAILKQTKGNTRRIVVNLAKAEQIAQVSGHQLVDLSVFGGAASIISTRAPDPRRAA